MPKFSILYGSIAAPNNGKIAIIEAFTAQEAFEVWAKHINLSIIHYARIAEGEHTLKAYHNGQPFAPIIENNRWAAGCVIEKDTTEENYREYLSR